MHRHQSNPFLSDWDADESGAKTVPLSNNSAKIFDDDLDNDDEDQGAGGEAARSGAKPELVERRRSAGQTENPFSNPDRRLYQRNMSSFEAASLQLEQVQMGDVADLSDDQSRLIAKLTADFESMIATNDKEFSIETATQLDADGNPIKISAFDPFETITDDDVSLTSPALPPPDEQVDAAELVGDTNTTPGHESIDNDDELVSTPVRNIKLSSGLIDANRQVPGGEVASEAGDDRGDVIDVEGGVAERGPTTTSSITKASMFASLLASAESGQQQHLSSEPNGVSAGGGSESAKDSQPAEGEDPLVEGGAHVIRGASVNADGSVERPVGFFDPFETVIDKDELTNLMTTNQQTTADEQQQQRSTTMSSLNPQAQTDRCNFHNSSISVETVVENGAKDETTASNLDSTPTSEEQQQVGGTKQSPPSDQQSRQQQQHELRGLPRPRASAAPPVVASQQVVVQPLATPLRRAAASKQSKKRSFVQGNSSDDDDDDDDDEERFQIVIKAREVGQAGGVAAAAPPVPLLPPPPPSRSSGRQVREMGQLPDMPSPMASYQSKRERWSSDEEAGPEVGRQVEGETRGVEEEAEEEEPQQFVIGMSHSFDEPDELAKPEPALYDDDTSYELEEFPGGGGGGDGSGAGWDMMLRYPPKKKITSNRFWKKIYVRLAQVPVGPPEAKASAAPSDESSRLTCAALQLFDKPDDKKPIQEIPIQPTYTVSEINSQQLDQFGKLFTIKLQYIFYKERVGVRQGQLARFIGHSGSSTTSGGHGVDPLSIGAIKRLGAPIEHSPQISQIVKLGCTSYEQVRAFKACLEDHLFRMPIKRDRALSTYKTEEVQMAVRDEAYLEVNQVGQVTRQLARTRLFLLSFLNGSPLVEVGVNDSHRQGREVVGRMDILPVVTDEWIRLEAWELHPTVDRDEFENIESRLIKLSPPDATYFELMRFRVRPPHNRELPLQVSASMSVSRTRVEIDCQVMVPGCVDRKMGPIPCEDIAIRVQVPECWVYLFREEKHFRMGSKKSVNRRPGVVKGLERLLGGGGASPSHLSSQQQVELAGDNSTLIEVTSGLAKYEHHHRAVVWRATRWPKDHQSVYVQNSMKIRLPLTAYDKMPDSFYEFLHVEYSMPATTVSHTAIRSVAVSPCDEEPPEKYVRYTARYEYKVRMRLNVNLSARNAAQRSELDAGEPPAVSPIVIVKQPDLKADLQRQEDSDSDDHDHDQDASTHGEEPPH